MKINKTILSTRRMTNKHKQQHINPTPIKQDFLKFKLLIFKLKMINSILFNHCRVNNQPAKGGFAGFGVAIAFAAASCIATHSVAGELTTGVYTGEFGHGKATLFIDSIKNNKVTGRSLYLHNLRPLNGTLKHNVLTLNEPNNRIGDGVFRIRLVNGELEGRWTVYKKSDTKYGIKPKTFRMYKSSCSYPKLDKDSFADKASLRLLKSQDLMMPVSDLDYLRNAIFARHGYSFKSKAWASLFATEKGYTPCHLSVKNKLTKIEKENIRRILDMTEYAKKNPDQFGR